MLKATNKAMQNLILVIEDEPAQAQILQYNLEAADFDVETAPTADEGMLLAEEKSPSLILLDWMLPDMSGIEVCRQLKTRASTKQIPIIMLTARGSEDDKVRGLDVGADDFVVKPHSIKELIARIKANLRKQGKGLSELSYGDIVMDTETHRVTRSGKNIHLGPTEYRLLRVFLERPRKVFSRSQILDRVWGEDIFVDERTVDVHMGRLRKALNAKNETDMIRTIRGTGYALDENT